MRHTFSAQFLKIMPPATNFGEAWENLCICLLRAETSDKSIMRLAPPDRGIDILRQKTREAYQCKSSEHGVLGTIESRECISSLARAIDARRDISWRHYSIALNAPLSGVGFSKISDFAKSHGVLEAVSFSHRSIGISFASVIPPPFNICLTTECSFPRLKLLRLKLLRR
jgi:hypothetical protein